MPREAAEPQGPAQADARLGRCPSDSVMEALKYSRLMGGYFLVLFPVGWRKWENRELSWTERMYCFCLEFFFYILHC